MSTPHGYEPLSSEEAAWVDTTVPMVWEAAPSSAALHSLIEDLEALYQTWTAENPEEER